METATEQMPALTLESVGKIVVFEVNHVDRIIEAVRKEALSLAVDVSTRKGREELKGQAFKVSQIKTRLVKLANDSIEEKSKAVKAVTSERTRLERELDKIRDEVKAPALEWEAKEERRKTAIMDRMQQIREQAMNLDGLTVEGLTARINEVIRLSGEQFEEFDKAAQCAADASMTTLQAATNARKQADADAAELAKLREIQAKREAEDAARAEKEAADLAEAARKAAELKAAQDAKERAEREAQEAAEREERRKLEQENAIKAAEGKAAQRERDRIEAEQRQKDEAAKREADAEAARKMAAELAEANRKADETHRRKVREEAADALNFACQGLDPAIYVADARTVIAAIERGEVPHVTINF